MEKKLLQVKRLLFTLIVLAFSTSYLHAQVAINEDGSAPDNSAMLDVKSADKGLLIPRLTTAARTTLGSSAVAGLMVWDTDLKKFFFFNGTGWDEGSTGGLWSENGSKTYLTNLGGNVGIGTTTPSYQFDIRSSSGSAFLRVKSTYGYAGMIFDKASESSNAYIIYRTGGELNKGWLVGMINNNDFSISRSSITSDGTFYIDSTSGYIGIGTIDPQRRLEIKGSERTARLTSSTSAAYLEFVNTNTTDWAIGSEIGTMRIQSSEDGFATSTLQYVFGNGFFHPSSNNVRSLGLSPYRWSNVYSVDGDFSENVTIGDTLKVTGKAGIGIGTPARTLEVRGPWRTARISSTQAGSSLEFVSTTADDWAVATWNGSLYLLNSADDFANKTDEYIFSTSGFYPVSDNARILGAGSNRWSTFYSVTGNFSGAVATGALTTTGNATFTGSVGIGTTTPNQSLDIHKTSGSSFARIKSDDSYAGIMIEKGDALDNGYILYRTGSTNYWSVGMIGDNNFNISTTYSSSGSKFFINSSGQVGIGTTSPATNYKLSVAGKIICEELRVDLIAGWPDYVFGKDYKLMSLKELDAFIETNGHLPNIPAAEEIKESGLEVGEMQRLMMEKIEELSLYIIQQQKEIDELKTQINKSQR